MAAKIPAAPKGTGPSGRALWRDVLGRYELEQHELLLLREACRTVDELDELRAVSQAEGAVVTGPHGVKTHPAITSAQTARVTLARLLAALRIPDDDQDTRPQRRGTRGVYRLVRNA
jgi:hypothetical protein